MEAFPAPAQISLVRPDGSGGHPVTNVSGGFAAFGRPLFSPDGTKIIAEGRIDPKGDRRLWMINADGSNDADGSKLHVLAIAAPVSFPDSGTAPIQQ